LTQRATKAAQDGGTLLGGTQTAYNGLTSDNKGGEHYLYDSAIQAEDVQNSGTLTNGFVNGALIAGADAGESFGNSTFAGYVPNGQIGPITLPFDPVSGGIFYTTDSVNNSNIVQASITANRSAASATNDGVYSLNAVGYINVEDTNALAALAARNGAIEFNRANLQYAEASDLSGTLQELDHSEKTQAAQSGPRASTNGVFGRSRSFVEALQPSASPPLADASAGTSAATAARGRRSGRGGGGAGGAGGGGGVFGGAGGAIGGAGGTLPLQGSNGYNALRSGASSFLSGSGSTLANPSGAFPGEGPVGQQISRDREGLDIPTEGAVANNLYDLYWGEGAADKFPQAMAVTNSIYLADNSDAPPYQVRQQAASVDTWDGNTYPAASPVSGLGARNNITAGKINQPSGTPLSSSSPKLALATPLAPATRPLSTRSQDVPLNPATPPPVPQPEIQTRDNAFSTFSLNVSDVSFKLAAASLQKGVLPDPATVRSEEFINAFDYRDIEPTPGAPIGFAWERASYPFAHNRDLLRFSVKTAAQGREAGRPINIVLLLDKSGSMERADRVAIIREALRVLAAQLQPRDTLSVVVFARTARLWADGVSGSQAGALADALEGITPEGGTNLEEAMKLAYETALRHYLANGENRVVLLTDGAANLGDVEPEDLKKKAAANRTQGIALDCFGVGWEDYNDNLLEVLSRAGGGRYGFINAPEEAATEFAGQLAGALRVAASDVKVQVEFNPGRVTSYRQIGYAKDQLTKEQFRDNTVKAAQLGVKESGNALYTVEINPQGDGPLCTVHVRYRAPGTSDYYEHAWDVPYTGVAPSLDQAGPAIRLAASVSAFSEWLAGNSYAGEVTPDQLLGYMRGVPEIYGADTRPALLAQMLREAKSISGK
jgi:Mg-chelatase subunit ChlD